MDNRTKTIQPRPAPPNAGTKHLALAEGRIDYEQVFVDIHFRGSQQLPGYVRLNPNMTVPTLALPGRNLDQSRDILCFALAPAKQEPARHELAKQELAGQELDAETTSWVDLHYAYPIEELTFDGFLARHALARAIIPAMQARPSFAAADIWTRFYAGRLIRGIVFG